ncbi:MAG: AEC family transporter [Campylobacteraceae bacterium]
MLVVFNSLFPIFALIITGYVLKIIKFPNETFWAGADRITYYLFFPCMLIYSLAMADFRSVDNAFLMVGIVVLAIFSIAIILVILQWFCKFDVREFTSLFQGSTRFNTYVLVGVVNAFYGSEGILLSIFIITFLVPVVNFLCVGMFVFYLKEGKVSYKNLLISLITNPMILSCIIGGILNFSGLRLPTLIAPIIQTLSEPAIPLGLLSVGVGLTFKSFKTKKLTFWLAIFFKLMLLPSLMFGYTAFFDIDGMMRGVMVLYTAVPTAVASYILARQMGGDLSLMSAIITAQTIFAFATLSVIMVLLV